MPVTIEGMQSFSQCKQSIRELGINISNDTSSTIVNEVRIESMRALLNLFEKYNEQLKEEKNEMIEIKMDRWYAYEGKFYAYWNNLDQVQDLGIKGCPMGRGKEESEAILDLIKRTNMESNTNICISDVTIVN